MNRTVRSTDRLEEIDSLLASIDETLLVASKTRLAVAVDNLMESAAIPHNSDRCSTYCRCKGEGAEEHDPDNEYCSYCPCKFESIPKDDMCLSPLTGLLHQVNRDAIVYQVDQGIHQPVRINYFVSADCVCSDLSCELRKSQRLADLLDSSF